MKYTAHDPGCRVISLSQLNTFKGTASMLALGGLLMTASPSDAQNAGQPGAALPPVTVDAPAQRTQRPIQTRRRDAMLTSVPLNRPTVRHSSPRLQR
jgi:iron complex outermembrane receptor protein